MGNEVSQVKPTQSNIKPNQSSVVNVNGVPIDTEKFLKTLEDSEYMKKVGDSLYGKDSLFMSFSVTTEKDPSQNI